MSVITVISCSPIVIKRVHCPTQPSVSAILNHKCAIVVQSTLSPQASFSTKHCDICQYSSILMWPQMVVVPHISLYLIKYVIVVLLVVRCGIVNAFLNYLKWKRRSKLHIIIYIYHLDISVYIGADTCILYIHISVDIYECISNVSITCRYLRLSVFIWHYSSACTTILTCTCNVSSFMCIIILYTAIMQTLLITVRVWMLIWRHVFTGEWLDICHGWVFCFVFHNCDITRCSRQYWFSLYSWISSCQLVFASIVLDLFSQTAEILIAE